VKIAFIAPEFYPPVGGVGIYGVNLVKGLYKFSDLEIHIFTPKRGTNYGQEKVDALFDGKVKIYNITEARDTFIYNLKFQLGILKEFPSYQENNKYDLIHITSLGHQPDIFLKLKGFEMPNIVTVHTTIKNELNGSINSDRGFLSFAENEWGTILFYPYISSLERIYLRKTKSLITVSKMYAYILEKKYNYTGNIYTIYNGIDVNMFSPILREDPYRYFPRLKGIRSPIILYASRITGRKGIGTFVKAMKKLINEEVHFVIAGGGSKKLLDNLLTQYNISENKYTILGTVDHQIMPYLYALSTIYVLPSMHENCPYSLLEAMAMGIPCIATNVGGIPEIIENGINGFLFEPKDVDKLVSIIKKILADEALKVSIGKNARETVVNKFTIENMAKQTQMVYERVLNNNVN